MARFWSGEIAGIPLLDGGEDAGFDLTGAERFEYLVTGNSVRGASGFLHTQYGDYINGKPLDIAFIHIPQALATTLLAALKPLLLTEGVVPCTFTDGWQIITDDFKPNVPNWFSRGNPDGDFINDFVLRLITPGVLAP